MDNTIPFSSGRESQNNYILNSNMQASIQAHEVGQKAFLNRKFDQKPPKIAATNKSRDSQRMGFASAGNMIMKP